MKIQHSIIIEPHIFEVVKTIHSSFYLNFELQVKIFSIIIKFTTGFISAHQQFRSLLNSVLYRFYNYHSRPFIIDFIAKLEYIYLKSMGIYLITFCIFCS